MRVREQKRRETYLGLEAELDKVVRDLGHPTPANTCSIHARSIGVHRLCIDRSLTDEDKMTMKISKVSVRKRWRGKFRPPIRLSHTGCGLRANVQACGLLAAAETEATILGIPLLIAISLRVGQRKGRPRWGMASKRA